MDAVPAPEAPPAAAADANPFTETFPRLAPLWNVYQRCKEAQLRPLKQQKHYMRLLELAEATLGRDIEPSMVLAHIYHDAIGLFTAPLRAPDPDDVDAFGVHQKACWEADPARTLEFSRRCTALLLRRFNSGTLLELRPEEMEWIAHGLCRTRLRTSDDPGLAVLCSTTLCIRWPFKQSNTGQTRSLPCGSRC